MSDKLIIWKAAKEVNSAVATILNTYHSHRVIHRQEMAALDVKIKAFAAKTYSHEVGEIIRSNINEIAATQRYIDQQNLNGPALDMAMEQLRSLNTLLQDNLNSIRR